MAVSNQFKVRILDHDTVVYEGLVWALSSVNDIGPFDILAKHTNFISVIKNQVTLHFDEKNKRFLPVEFGVLRAFNQDVEVYLGIQAHAFEVPEHE